MSGIYGLIAGAESGFQNITNTTQSTSSGSAAGYFQITPGTWAQFAPQAGVSLTAYPATPQGIESASYGVQKQVASVIPLNRWASSTVNAVESALGGNVDPTQTLGQIAGNYSQPGAGSGVTNMAGGGVAGGAGAGGGSGSLLNPANWFSAFTGWLGRYATRGAMILLAVIFLMGAVLLFAERTQVVSEAGPA